MVTLVIIPLQRDEIAYLCVDDLMRMYVRWVYRNQFKCIITQYPTEQGAGQVLPHPLNSAELGGALWEIIHIDCPLSLLADETGVHHFRRVSPYDTQGRVHSCHIVVTVTGAKFAPTKPIRSYDFVRGKATDLVRNETMGVMRILNAEHSFGAMQPAPAGGGKEE